MQNSQTPLGRPMVILRRTAQPKTYVGTSKRLSLIPSCVPLPDPDVQALGKWRGDHRAGG